MRQVVRRLEGRERTPPSQSVQVPAPRDAIPESQDERRSSKKSPRLGTIGQVSKAWEESRPRYSTDWQIARTCGSTWHDLNPHQLTATHINGLVVEWKKKHRLGTAYGYTASLKRLLKFIDRVSGTHHAEDVPRVNKALQRSTVCTDEDYGKLLAVSPTWFKVFLGFCRELGLRNSEARTLSPAHFNTETGTVTFDRKMCGTSHLPVPPSLTKAILFAREINPTAPVIITLGARTNAKTCIYGRWCQTLKDSGANPELVIHDLRRTAATKLYDATRDLRLAQKMLGHRNLASTLYYIGTRDAEELRTHLAAIAPRKNATLRDMEPATQVKQ